MTNRPTIDDILQNPDRLRNQPLDVLDILAGEAAVLAANAAMAKKLIAADLERRYAPAIDSVYAAAGKDAGTVHVTDGGWDIEANRAKKIEWDGAKLAVLWDEIAAAGDDPAELIKRELTVQERVYTALPSFLRAKLEPARTLKPGPLSLKLTAAKAEAA